MAYTGHGHYIVGSKKTGKPPKFKTRCYGDRRCPHCRSDIERYWEKHGADPVEEKKMDVVIPKDNGNSFQEKAKGLVENYILDGLEKTDPTPKFDVYVVWFSKTLQHWKALISTTLPDGMYYEVTYNGDRKETYIDAYKKFDNVCIRDED